jgi:hypothetical protein
MHHVFHRNHLIATSSTLSYRAGQCHDLPPKGTIEDQPLTFAKQHGCSLDSIIAILDTTLLTVQSWCLGAQYADLNIIHLFCLDNMLGLRTFCLSFCCGMLSPSLVSSFTSTMHKLGDSSFFPADNMPVSPAFSSGFGSDFLFCSLVAVFPEQPSTKPSRSMNLSERKSSI